MDISRMPHIATTFDKIDCFVKRYGTNDLFVRKACKEGRNAGDCIYVSEDGRCTVVRLTVPFRIQGLYYVRSVNIVKCNGCTDYICDSKEDWEYLKTFFSDCSYDLKWFYDSANVDSRYGAIYTDVSGVDDSTAERKGVGVFEDTWFNIIWKNLSKYSSIITYLDGIRYKVERNVHDHKSVNYYQMLIHRYNDDLIQVSKVMCGIRLMLDGGSAGEVMPEGIGRLRRFSEHLVLSADLCCQNIRDTQQYIDSLSNRALNNSMSVLAEITLVLSIPTLIAGYLGISVVQSYVDIASWTSIHTLLFVVLIPFVISFSLLFVLKYFGKIPKSDKKLKVKENDFCGQAHDSMVDRSVFFSNFFREYGLPSWVSSNDNGLYVKKLTMALKGAYLSDAEVEFIKSLFDKMPHSDDSLIVKCMRNKNRWIKVIERYRGSFDIDFLSMLDSVDDIIFALSYYQFSDNRLVYSPDGKILFRCFSEERAVQMKTGVRSIEKSAFSNCKNLTALCDNSLSKIKSDIKINISQNNPGYSFTIPSTITLIGDSAFEGCEGIKGKLVIPTSLRSIGNRAFSGCIGLKEIEMPGNVKVGECAFIGCSNLHGAGIETSEPTQQIKDISNNNQYEDEDESVF